MTPVLGPTQSTASPPPGYKSNQVLDLTACCAIPCSMQELSFRRYILNAFAGVGNVLSSRMETEMLYGVPERHLLQGLPWWSDNFTIGRDEALGWDRRLRAWV
ncbi:hypothetical protein QBC41DRAFT_347669 [Cercophora samala]|uniref:Uncharacterized protein n=1 Tax=Cercophora samala TaxID=330535 RepID=A0AA39ZBE0_9PEZI|nr:hypothetical protein QBC41DRAFT_347669 [Cercophora samala]